MNDDEFEQKYRECTKTRHVCNNYNRLLLDDEIRRDSNIMLNFVDILKNELGDDHIAIEPFLSANDYDSDSILVDAENKLDDELYGYPIGFWVDVLEEEEH